MFDFELVFVVVSVMLTGLGVACGLINGIGRFLS